MEVFVEEASSYEKCLDKIHSKYGPNIKVTRRETMKKKTFFGLSEKDVVKMNFYLLNEPFTPDTYENQPEKEIVQVRTVAPSRSFIPPNEESARLAIMATAASKSDNIKEQIAPFLNKSIGEKSISEVPAKNSATNGISGEEMKKLANTVEKLAEQINKNNNTSEEHANIKRIAEILEDNDFTAKYIRDVKALIKESLSLVQLDDFDFLQKTVIKWIAESIKIKRDPMNLKEKGRIISLVGPTGIGKTTTIAKLAAYFVIEGSRMAQRLLNVQVISIDHYRIGATFQIKKYCELMKIPIAIAESPYDFCKYIDLYKESSDIVCVDTTGRSPSDVTKIVEMQAYFESINGANLDSYLVVSAVSKAMDIKEIMKQYKGFNYSSLIISKIDETATVGSIISVLDRCDTPVSFITTGQHVPHDLKFASKNFLLKKLKGFTLGEDFFDKNFDDDETISWAKNFW